MGYEIKTNESISNHYTTSFKKCAGNISGAEKSVTYDGYTNCESIKTARTIHRKCLQTIKAYASKLEADTGNMTKAHAELTELDHRKAADMDIMV